MSTTPNYVTLQAFPALAGFFNVVSVLVSTGTVITLPNFTTITNALAMRQDTQTTVTLTISNNTLTVTTGGLTNVYIIVLVGGTR